MDVIVVGGGMAGLQVATSRVLAGDTVTVLDKGRRHGGRMASRRVDDAVFDQGVLDFAAHGPSFTAALRTWADQGVARQVEGTDRWRGHPTMRSLPSALAFRCGAPVQCATAVTRITVDAGRWRVTATSDAGSENRHADALVLTLPAPQTLALLAASSTVVAPSTLAALQQVTYTSSLTVLTRPRGRVGARALTDAAHRLRAEGDVAAVHRSSSTADDVIAGLTVQASAEYSAVSLDGDRAAAARTLADRVARHLGTPLDVVYVHGWRYAQVQRRIPLPAVRDDTPGAPLILAGDFCDAVDGPEGIVQGGSAPEGVERAFLSGRAGARLLDGDVALPAEGIARVDTG